MLKIFVTSFEIWSAKTAFWVLSAQLFVSEEFLGWLRCEKNLTLVAALWADEICLFTPKCLNFGGFSKDLLNFMLQIRFFRTKNLFKICLVLSFKQSYFIKNTKKRIFQLSTAKILGKSSMSVRNPSKLRHFGVKRPDFADLESHIQCQIFFATQAT